MFSEINRAVEEATQKFRGRMYDTQMNVPGIAETYVILNTLRWPIDFLNEYAGKNNEPHRTPHA